jgi:hypothetical protein
LDEKATAQQVLFIICNLYVIQIQIINYLRPAKRKIMAIKIKVTNANNNGCDGIHIEGGGNMDMDIEVINAVGNGGQGINIIKHASILEELGLPKETNPQALAELLQQLQSVPPEDRQQIVKKSRLMAQLAKFALESSTIIANVITIASSPSVIGLIENLSR